MVILYAEYRISVGFLVHNFSMIQNNEKAVMFIKKQHCVLVVLGKLFLVFFYALRVLWDIYRHFEKLEQGAREERLRQWALKMLNVMDIQVQQEGEEMLAKNCLRASNHISWLDIVVLYACKPCRFIAKSEVKKYLVIGRFARNAGTVFLDRSNIKDAIRVSEQISEALKSGDCIAFFPEATTSEGDGLLPLHPSLFESALRAGCYVQTVVLRFHRAQSTRAAKYAAYVYTSLLVTLWKILRYGQLRATVTCMMPFQPLEGDTRHLVCAQVQAQMEAVLNRLNYNPADFAHTGVESIQVHLQFSFIDDALLWLMDAQERVPALMQDTQVFCALMELRQLANLLKGGATSVGFAHYSDVARILETCLSHWIKTKKIITVELSEFVCQTLRELRQWQTQLPQGDITKEQVELLLEKARALMAPYEISTHLIQQSIFVNATESSQNMLMECANSRC